MNWIQMHLNIYLALHLVLTYPIVVSPKYLNLMLFGVKFLRIIGMI